MTSSGDDGTDLILFRGLFVFGLVVAVSGVLIGTLAAGATFSPLDSSTGNSGSIQVDPSIAGEEGDLSPVERRLAEQLAQRARSGGLNLSRSTIDQARESLDDSQYSDLLNQYDEVADETGQTNRSQAFATLQQQQREYVGHVERYWDLYSTYENLTANATTGRVTASPPAVNETTPPTPTVTATPTPTERTATSDNDSVTGSETTSTLAVAREMEQTARRVNESGQRLVEQYDRVANVSGESYDEQTKSVRTTTTNISETQAEVRKREFTETQLDVELTRTQISFTDPLVVSGRLETIAGSPITNENVTVNVGERTLPTQTDGNGTFALSYRPVRLPLNASTLTLAYVPSNTSVYLGSETTVNVTLQQVDPTIAVSTVPDVAGYDDNVTVSGRVSAGSVAVPNTTYAMRVDGRVFAIDQTAPDGTFEQNISLPKSVESGTQNVTVNLLAENQAIGNASGSTPLEIIPRPTELTLSAEPIEGREVDVRGRLSLPGGRNVTNATVDIVVNGTAVASVPTDDDGQYSTVVLVPEDVVQSGNETVVAVSVSFDGTGTNLETSRATATVVLRNSAFPLVPAAVLAVLFVAVAYLFATRRPWRWVLGGDGETDSGGQTTGEGETILGPDEETPVTQSLLASARDQLASGRPDAAVQTGYAALRSRLEPAVGDEAQTHWEFYRACKEGNFDQRTTDVIEAVTQRYEQVTFAAETVSEQTARETLERIDTLTGDSTASPADD